MIDENKTWQVGIKGLVFNDEGKLLLIQEPNGKWELPGGRIEHGETFHETLKREIKEEMGVECEVLDEQPYWAWHHQMDDGRWKILLGFRTRLTSFDFIKTEECVDSKFFDKQELMELGDKLYTNGFIKFL